MSSSRITEAAKSAWLESGSVLSFSEFLAAGKNAGKYWGADDA